MNNKVVEIDEETIWYDEEYLDPSEEDSPIDEYDVTATPNDFNISTIFNFIESGALKIPGFQRNYVWDIRRASKLIESIVIGLPVPQIFLYEEARNRFLVIDGQQRLMSIYYFIKQRFPRKESSGEIRRIFDEHGRIPDNILHDPHYFSNFNLRLSERLPEHPNKFNGLNYSTLGDYQTAFDLRTVRNVIVKQVSPKDDDSSVFEIFSRLNSGGINVTLQEIRRCMYDSKFFEMLYRANMHDSWRRLVGVPYPDLHMKDVEILLRGFALLIEGSTYSSSMAKFLNVFSKNSKRFSDNTVSYLHSLFESFLDSCSELPADAFFSTSRRFSTTLFESVFGAVCQGPYTNKGSVIGKIEASTLIELKGDPEFMKASEVRTTNKQNVDLRLIRARDIIRVQ